MKKTIPKPNLLNVRKNILPSFEQLKTELHLPLLAFLVIFTVDKILLKFVGIAVIYLLHPDFKFRANLRRIPLFYLLLVGLEILKFFLFNRDFGKGHLASFSVGCIFWLMAFLAIHQFRTIVDTTDQPRIHRTLKLFFAINVAISIINLVVVIYQSGNIDPYRLIESPVYGNSTGDHIKGLFMGPSYINMMINTFFIFYFLYKKEFRLTYIAMLVTLFTTSNFCNLVLIPILLACLIFSKERRIKLSIVTFIGMMILFYLIVSPRNFKYLKDSLFVSAKHQQELALNENKALISQYKDKLENIAHEDSAAGTANAAANAKHAPAKTNAGGISSALSVDSLKLAHSADSLKKVVVALESESPDSPRIQLNLEQKFGKVLAFKETAKYLTSSPRAFLFGAGMGNFSSFLAERMSHVNEEQGSKVFEHMPIYIAPDYYNNHYKIFKTTFAMPQEFHSVKHFPSSFVNQILGEYGVVGLALFLAAYVWFFIKHYRRLSYGKYLLFLMGGFLLFDYLFEYLSVVCIFELLMLLDIPKSRTATVENAAGVN
jgi:hypothetical protein